MKLPYQMLTFAYGAFVFWLLTRPQLFETPAGIPFNDTAAHFVLFAGMAGVIVVGMYRSNPAAHPALLLWAPFAGSFLYGAFLEVVQIYVPLRQFEWQDIAANGSGAFAAQCGFWYWRRRRGMRIRERGVRGEPGAGSRE